MLEANPTCPFCFAPWSEKMVRQLEASTLPGGCGCCVDGPSAAHVVSWPIAPEPQAEPAPEPEDIACSACGKVLYAAFTG